MDSYSRRVSSFVRKFDKDLFCRLGPDGVYRVIQKSFRWTPYQIEGASVAVKEETSHLVFSLTDTWSGNGSPVRWGLEPIYQKLSEISLSRRDALIREIEESHKKAEEKKEKDAMSNFETMALETRDIYKKTFSDILTHSMDKSKDVRRKIERKTKWQS